MCLVAEPEARLQPAAGYYEEVGHSTHVRSGAAECQGERRPGGDDLADDVVLGVQHVGGDRSGDAEKECGSDGTADADQLWQLHGKLLVSQFGCHSPRAGRGRSPKTLYLSHTE